MGRFMLKGTPEQFMATSDERVSFLEGGAAELALTTGMPATTLANAVYLPSNSLPGPVQMKNDVSPALLGSSSSRAIETMPATCFVLLNSGPNLWMSRRCRAVSGSDR